MSSEHNAETVAPEPPPITRAEWNRTHAVMLQIKDERARQITKWGGREGDGIENPNQSHYVRLGVLAEKFVEVAEAVVRPEDGDGKRDLVIELVQVAAVAVAWLEALLVDGESDA